MSSDATLFQESLVDDSARTARPYTVSFSLTMQMIAAAAAISYPLWHIEPLPRIALRAPSPFRSAVQLVDPAPARPASGPQMSASNALSAPAAERRAFVAPTGRFVAADDTGLVITDGFDVGDPGTIPVGFVGSIPGAPTGPVGMIAATRPVEKPSLTFAVQGHF